MLQQYATLWTSATYFAQLSRCRRGEPVHIGLPFGPCKGFAILCTRLEQLCAHCYQVKVKVPTEFSELDGAQISKGPRWLKAGLRKLPFGLDDIDETYSIWFSSGTVRLAALGVPERTLVVVEKDLVVDGVLDDRPLCSDPENMRALVVGGSLQADAMLLGSEAIIGGNVQIARWLVAESDGDFTLTVGGNLRCSELIALGQHIAVKGKLTANWKIGYLGIESDVDKGEMATAFLPELINSYGGVDIEKIAERLLQGKPVRRNP
jgi:hypothetical protein